MGENDRIQTRTANEAPQGECAAVCLTTTKLHLETLGLARLVIATPPKTWNQWHWIRVR